MSKSTENAPQKLLWQTKTYSVAINMCSVQEFAPFSLSEIEVKPLFEDRTFSLGPTNPSSNPVHLEPLSTLVIKVLI
jgi:hypothetical protein